MITHAGTDDHAACIHLIQTVVVLREQLELRADDSAKIRQTDKTAVQMSGKSKVRTPGSIFFKKDRIVCQKDLVCILFSFSDASLHADNGRMSAAARRRFSDHP